jgi:hypothetical protein
VADTSPGPGWWQASDGRWYAPDAHPRYGPPAPPPAPAPAPGTPPSNSRRWWPWIAVGVAVAVVLILVAIFSQPDTSTDVATTTAPTAPTTSTSTSTSTTVPSSTTTGAASASGMAHVGGTLALVDGSGHRTEVVLSQVIDPATGTDGPPANGDGTPTTDSYVALNVMVMNTGPIPVADDANQDALLFGSDGHKYPPNVNSVTQCTNFTQGSYSLQPDQTVSGCVVFVLPAGVAPVKLQWTPGGLGNQFGEWWIP